VHEVQKERGKKELFISSVLNDRQLENWFVYMRWDLPCIVIKCGLFLNDVK
jgi:hypothetical protein